MSQNYRLIVISIDKLRKASVEREKYIGPWLPEPLIASTSPTPEEELETASDLSMAFMVLLERLTPVERAAFLLHDVFDFVIGSADLVATRTQSRRIIY